MHEKKRRRRKLQQLVEEDLKRRKQVVQLELEISCHELIILSAKENKEKVD